ncbi:MAG: twin-arginine translocation signal domain-containing protein [Arenicella sp.]|nr:twin-arginine translocation signal domain-containing protein [Arenicella sp.]
MKDKNSSDKRRNLLKGAAAVGTGAVIATEWSKPLVNSILTPAHAQTSTTGLTASTSFNSVA